MRRINLTALVLMCLVTATFTFTTSAQQKKNTCIINGRVINDCYQQPNGVCLINNQIPVKCDAKPKAFCADGGPLIIRLNKATNFYERSVGYGYLNDNLKCRGINIGFFGAASDVTWAFHVDESFVKRFTGGFPDISDKFLSLASNHLVGLNSAEFKEIIDTSKLSVMDNRGVATYLTNAVEIDRELIRREQVVVENGLVQTGLYRNAIVTGINARIKWNLDNFRYVQTPVNPTMKAIAKVRDNMRVFFPNAEYDYGNIYNRMAVGEILAAEHRK